MPAAKTGAGHTPGPHKCHRCGCSWAIVNACGCDPENLPTRPVSATPTPWASGEHINGDKQGIYTVAYETAHPQKVATVNDPGDVPYIVRAMNSRADLLAACQLAAFQFDASARRFESEGLHCAAAIEDDNATALRAAMVKAGA